MRFNIEHDPQKLTDVEKTHILSRVMSYLYALKGTLHNISSLDKDSQRRIRDNLVASIDAKISSYDYQYIIKEMFFESSLGAMNEYIAIVVRNLQEEILEVEKITKLLSLSIVASLNSKSDDEEYLE